MSDRRGGWERTKVERIAVNVTIADGNRSSQCPKLMMMGGWLAVMHNSKVAREGTGRNESAMFIARGNMGQRTDPKSCPCV